MSFATFHPLGADLLTTLVFLPTVSALVLAFFPAFEEAGKNASTRAPTVGRKTSVVRRSAPKGWKVAKLIGLSHPHVDEEHGDPERERERVVAHMPRREETQEVARQLHEERRGVRDAVDEERVESPPEERPDLPERREDEHLDAFVHVPLVRHEASEGAGLLVEGVRLRRNGLRRPVCFAIPAPRPGEDCHGDAEGEEHEADLEPVRHLVDLRVRDGSSEETPDPVRAAEGRGDADEASDDGEGREYPERDRHRRGAFVGVLSLTMVAAARLSEERHRDETEHVEPVSYT